MCGRSREWIGCRSFGKATIRALNWEGGSGEMLGALEADGGDR